MFPSIKLATFDEEWAQDKVSEWIFNLIIKDTWTLGKFLLNQSFSPTSITSVPTLAAVLTASSYWISLKTWNRLLEYKRENWFSKLEFNVKQGKIQEDLFF